MDEIVDASSQIDRIDRTLERVLGGLDGIQKELASMRTDTALDRERLKQVEEVVAEMKEDVKPVVEQMKAGKAAVRWLIALGTLATAAASIWALASKFLPATQTPNP